MRYFQQAESSAIRCS